MKRAIISARELFLESVKVSLILFKVMIPVIIIVKILEVCGAIKFFAACISPLMKLVGLPGDLGIVWGTTLLTNLYGGIAVFLTLSPGLPLTVAQVTIMTSMMLIAHAMPMELSIARQAGARYSVMLLIRVGGALIYGAILNFVCTCFNLLQSPNKLMWKPAAVDNSIGGWIYAQVINLIMVFVIIFVLMTMMKILKKLGVTALFSRALTPILAPVGIGSNAINITTIGMMLGIIYGAGLILSEAKLGHIHKKDLFFSLALMGLCHSIIEDTLLMMSIGANFAGIFVGRFLFALIFVFLLVKLVSLLSERQFDKFFFKHDKQP